MLEPSKIATLIREVVPGVYRFTLHDDRIHLVSVNDPVTNESHAVLLNPLPMRLEDLGRIGIRSYSSHTLLGEVSTAIRH